MRLVEEQLQTDLAAAVLHRTRYCPARHSGLLAPTLSAQSGKLQAAGKP